MSREKPVLRALKLLSLIERNPNGIRVKDLADQLSANSRAVYRDIQVLEALRIPLYTDRDGKESFWKIDPEYRNKLTIPFTLTELLSFYLSQNSVRPLEGTIFHDSLDSLFGKVMAHLPKPLFRRMVNLRKSFHSEIPARKDYRVYREFIKLIQEAVEGRKALLLRYRPLGKTPAERSVDPYAVHLHNGTLYLIGYCHLRKDIRSFVVDRMQSIKLAGGSFVMPLDFSLEKYLRHSFGMMREDMVRVKVRFDKSLTRYLLERRWHPSQTNKKLKDGSLDLSFEVAGTREIKNWVLGFGSRARVLEPAALVAEIKGDLAKALRSY